MFSRPNVAVRVSNVAHNQMEQDDTEIPLTILTCEVAPLTPELAGDLHDFVRRTLYTSTDVEVNSLLRSAAFDLSIPAQAVAFRMAPDQTKASFQLEEAKIDGIKAKRSKKSTAWTLEFKLTCSPASAKQLESLVESYLKVKYLTFENAVPSLFDETPRAAAPVETDDEPELPEVNEPAPATH